MSELEPMTEAEIEEFKARFKKVLKQVDTRIVRQALEFAETALANCPEGEMRAEVCREILKERDPLEYY
jgi:hypothetical protein